MERNELRQILEYRPPVFRVDRVKSHRKSTDSGLGSGPLPCFGAPLLPPTCSKQPFREPLKDFNFELHDKYFLPTPLWADLTDVLSELSQLIWVRI